MKNAPSQTIELKKVLIGLGISLIAILLCVTAIQFFKLLPGARDTAYANMAGVTFFNNSSWNILVFKNGIEPLDPANLAMHTITFENDKVVGKICNTFQGKYMIKDNAVKTGIITSTRMYCDDKTMSQEQQLIKSLEKGMMISMNGKNLVLKNMEGIYVELEPVMRINEDEGIE